jgi:flagellar hook-associated protein 2
MATVTSTTATPTPSTTSVTKSAASALLTSLDTGSGVDTDALVTGLVEAQFAAKTAALTAKSDKLTSQLSGVSTLKSAITDFASALEALVKGGSLQAQPASSNNSVLTATAITGAKLTGLTGSIRVDRLATAQAAVSGASVATKDTVLGTGTLTLKLGTASYDTNGAMTGLAGTDADGDGAEDTISINVTTGSLTDIAAAINATKAGVTASVVTDADGKAFLSLKGETGTAKAFTLTATDDPTGNLSKVNVGPGATGMNITGKAGNAQLTVDGITVERASNSVSDLIDGVKLDLVGTSSTAVTLSSSTPTTAITNAIEDVVYTYNSVMAELKKQTDPITGDLRSDPGAQNLLRSLKALTTKDLLPGAAAGTPRTLAELGVNTNRDGTLSVNSDTLAKVMAANPAALEAMFSNASDGSGLMAAMNSVKLNATSTLYGLGASTTRYNQSKSSLADQQDKIADDRERLTTRMTQQFASMNSRVAAYKSTMTFMENQIKQWTNGDN